MQNLRLSSTVAAVSSPLMRSMIADLRLHKGVSEAVRTSLSMYASKAKQLKVPDKFKPPENYADRFFITVVVPPAARDEYISTAAHYGIPTSELVLRCLSAYMERGPNT